jgi:hypothetical protein
VHKALLRITTLVVALVAPFAARADVGDESVGINVHLPGDDVLDMCADLGVRWIRIDANWRDIHTGPGAFSFGEVDRVVASASARGLSVYMTLAYTPDWVARVPRSRTDTYGGNDEPAGSAEWVAFVEAAVARYSARGVTHFGLWNEPNLDGFWESPAGVDAYIDKILIPGSDAVNRRCATCLVLGPDLAHVGPYDVFLDRVLERAGGRFDIFTHHIYSGWPETGTEIWDGDRYLEALEMRRFPFTRASLREVMEARGMWGREIWITETGYRATPGDATEEANQETYVRRVLEEQLARAYWTNTFFYEITDCGVDDPSCPIDGFGITRGTRGLPRSFPADYRLKPAYAFLRGFIDAHPELTMSAPPPACANGLDDDGDGRTDAEDRGCTDGTDDDEADDPARRRLEALPASGIVLDGALDEWTADGTVALAGANWVGVVPHGGDGDASLTVRARWEPGVLYLGVSVADDVHFANDPDGQLYLGDSLQVAFDRLSNRSAGAYDADDHEINFASVSGATHTFRFFGTGDGSFTAAVARAGTTTSYEVRLPAAALGGPTLAEGTSLGFSFLVNDDDGGSTTDGSGREGWLELTPGIGRGKDPYSFGDVVLVSMVTPPIDAPAADGGSGRDGGGPTTDAAGLDAGGGADAGIRPPRPSDCACRASIAHPSATSVLGALALVLLTRRRR